MDTNKAGNQAYQTMLVESRKRATLAVKMQLAGKSLKEIGEALGVSRERARQLVAKGQRDAAGE